MRQTLDKDKADTKKTTKEWQKRKEERKKAKKCVKKLAGQFPNPILSIHKIFQKYSNINTQKNNLIRHYQQNSYSNNMK